LALGLTSAISETLETEKKIRKKNRSVDIEEKQSPWEGGSD
jgi:hypothetical protein